MEIVPAYPPKVSLAEDRARALTGDDRDRYRTFSVLKGCVATPGLGWVLIVNAEGDHEMISIEWLVELVGTSMAASLLGVEDTWVQLAPSMDVENDESTLGG